MAAGDHGGKVKPLPVSQLCVEQRWLEALGAGGFPTWQSSPSFMWLAYRLARSSS